LPVQDELRRLVTGWQMRAIQHGGDDFAYIDTLDELLYFGECRFIDYVQFGDTGSFAVHLKDWLGNLDTEEEKKLLFKLLGWLTFVDKKQMQALYQDAFSRIVYPWIMMGRATRDDYMSPRHDIGVLERLRPYHFLSITLSFNLPEFERANNLQGLPEMRVLGEDEEVAQVVVQRLATTRDHGSGLIILEDFVGTGNQVKRVLSGIRDYVNEDWRCLFVPLIMLQSGMQNIEDLRREFPSLRVEPVLVIPDSHCVKETPMPDEPKEFIHFRSLVRNTARRVIQPLDASDDPPTNPFGYEGSGALVVTCHNAPNNTLPILHHHAPRWKPLFQRIHHARR